MDIVQSYFTKEYIEKNLVSCGEYSAAHEITDRAFWDSVNPEIKKHYISEGESYLDYTWPCVPASSFLEYFRSGNRVVNQDINYGRRTALCSLVFAECFENKGRFTDQIINGIWSICEETTWAVSAHTYNAENGTFHNMPYPPETGHVLALFSLETAQCLAYIYRVMKKPVDAVSPAIIIRLKNELYERVFTPFIKNNCYWWMGFTGRVLNNWTPWCCCNVLSAAMLACDDDAMRRSIVEKITVCLDKYLTPYPEDGSCDEGTSYWFRAGGSLIEVLGYLNLAMKEKTDIFKEQKLHNIVDFTINNHVGGLYYVNFADGGAIIKNPEYYLIYHAGVLLNDDKYKHEAAYIAARTSSGITPPPHDNMRAQLYMEYYDEIAAVKATPAPEKSVWCEGTQVMISREYSEYGKGLFLAAKGGCNEESHNHNDVGSYVVYSDGKPVIIDAGVEVYTQKTFSDRRYEIWTMRSINHNLVNFGSAEQKNGTQFKADDVKCALSADADTFSLDIAGAYPCDAESVKRSFEFDRKNRRITINDKIALKTEDSIFEVIMLAEKPEINGSVISAGGCAVSVGCTVPFDIKTEKIDITDRNLLNVWGSAVYRATVNLRGKNKAAEISLEIKPL